MKNYKLNERVESNLLEEVFEVVTLGLFPASETKNFVVEDVDSGDKFEFENKKDAIDFMSNR